MAFFLTMSGFQNRCAFFRIALARDESLTLRSRVFWQVKILEFWSKEKFRVKCCQVCSSFGFQAWSLAFRNAAQHSVHPTGGMRRVFRQFVWLEVGSVKVA